MVDPERPAIIHLEGADRRDIWSYGQLKRASDALAVSLRAKGVGRGDRVAVFLAQHPHVMVVHFAVQKLGAVVLPLFTLFGEEALHYRLSDSGAKAIVTGPQDVERVMALCPRLPELQMVISTGAAQAPVLSLGDLLRAQTSDFRPAKTSPDDPAVMIYTSGTTGDPKGVLHGHRYLLGHLPCLELGLGFPVEGGAGWTPADWAWIGGLMDLAMPCLYYGVPLVSHRFAKFDPEAAYALMQKEKVTTAFIPPTALRLLQEVAVPRLGLQKIISGGEPLGGDLLAWGREALGAEINEIYGQTEANLLVAACDGWMARVPGAMGLPVPGHEIRLMGAEDRECGTGEVGEICLALPDPVGFLRYWNKPEETAAKVQGGWLRTGDLATRCADGQLIFHARDDDVITSAGYRVGPSEIEAALNSHEDVVMSAVVGAPDPIRTEVIVAHIVAREGADWTALEAALKERVREKVSAHLVPRRFISQESLPMTATGKIMRRALR